MQTKKFIIIIAFLICGILLNFYLTFMHEATHQQIFESYGINSKIHMLKNFPTAYTLPEEDCSIETCKFSHNLNEIIGYQLDAFYWLFFISFLFIIISILLIKSERRLE